MRSDFSIKDVLFASLFLVLLIGSNYFVYTTLLEKQAQQAVVLSSKLTTLEKNMNEGLLTTRTEFSKALEQEHNFSTSQVASLENRTLANFQKLQDYFNIETTKLKLNLQSQLSDVSTNIDVVKAQSDSVKAQSEAGLKDISKKVGGLEQKNSQLQEEIEKVGTMSADFSTIIDEVVQAAVIVKTSKKQGSGVFFDSRGYLLTNKHVIDESTTATVVDASGKSYAATIVGTASTADLAVLKIDATVSFLTFANDADVKVGEKVIAVGSPLGLSFSVTQGIISAVNRKIDSTGIGYVQTDVSINPGNSGGPLVNNQKKIIGINTLKISDTEGLGFAIPASVAKSIGQQATG